MSHPLQSDDPLAPLWTPNTSSPAMPMRYRSGRIVAWNRSTGENEVTVDGQTFENLPVIPGAFMSAAREGDAVTVLSVTDARGATTYTIAGLPLTPPSSRFAPFGDIMRPPICVLQQKVSQSMTGGTEQLDNLYPDIDQGGMSDFFNNQIIIQRDAHYHVSAATLINASASAGNRELYISVWRDGDLVAQAMDSDYHPAVTAIPTGLGCSMTRPLAAGDEIRAYAKAPSGDTTNAFNTNIQATYLGEIGS